MQSCPRFATYPAFTMTDACRLAHDLLDRPIAHSWSAPMEIRPATTDERCAHLDYRGVSAPSPLLCDVQPLVVCWRAGGFEGDSMQHVWHASEGEAEQRAISEHDLAWATSEAIIHFRFLSQRMPRAAALQVVVFALGGWILPPIEHASFWPAFVPRCTDTV